MSITRSLEPIPDGAEVGDTTVVRQEGAYELVRLGDRGKVLALKVSGSRAAATEDVNTWLPDAARFRGRRSNDGQLLQDLYFSAGERATAIDWLLE